MLMVHRARKPHVQNIRVQRIVHLAREPEIGLACRRLSGWRRGLLGDAYSGTGKQQQD
jgi:hypothetical protein